MLEANQSRNNLCKLVVLLRMCFKLAISTTIAGLSVFYATASNAQDIKVLARSDYFTDNILRTFERETGLSVEVTVYDPDSDQDILERVLSGNHEFDLLISPSNLLTTLINTEKVQMLGRGIAGLNQISSRIQRFLLDYNTNEDEPIRFYGVPFLWGMTGIGYNLEQYSNTTPNSIAYIFDPALIEQYATCGVGIVDAPNEVIGAALSYLGRDPLSRSKEDLIAAEEVLMKIKPYVTGVYSRGIGVRLEKGEFCLAYGWSGELRRSIMHARKNQHLNLNNLGFVIPENGGSLWIDILVIPAHVENTEPAKLFIQYLLDPNVAAAITRDTLLVSANVTANMQNGHNEFFDTNVVFPTSEIIKTTVVTPSISAEQMDDVIKLWERFKAE